MINDTLQLIYTSKAGASIIRSQPHDKAAIVRSMTNLARRHIEARLICGNVEIGFVFRQDGRWYWVFDPAYVEHNNAAQHRSPDPEPDRTGKRSQQAPKSE